MLSGTQHYTSGRFKADMREECEQWDTDPRERERTYCIPQSTEDEIPSYYSDHLFTWVKLMLSYDYTKRPTPGKIQRVAKRALHISFPHENESFSKGNTFEHSKKRKLEKMFQEEENIYYDLEQGQQTYTTLLRAWDSGLNSTNYEKDDFAGALQMFDVTNVTIAEDTVPHKDDTESGSTAVVLRGLEILRKRIEPGAVHTTYLGSHGDMQDPRRRKALTYPEDKFNFFSALNDRVKQLLETNPALSEVLEVMRHGNYMGTSFLLMGTVPDMGSRVFSHWHEAIFDVVRWMPSGTFD